jgi:hypothetical protein
MDGHLCYLSEVEYVVVGVGHLLDKEFAVEQPDLVELVLVDGVVYDGVGGGVLRGDKAVGGNHGDVPLLPVQRRWRRRLDRREEAIVVDVVVLLVVYVVFITDTIRVVGVEVAEVIVHVIVTVGRGDTAPPAAREGDEGGSRAGAQGEERRGQR